MSAEYDFADEKENTNEIPVDEQSTGDHEDSDGDGIQGPPPPTEFKRLLEVWAKDFERMEAAIYQQQAAADNISALETLRLHDSMDAATSTAEASFNRRLQYFKKFKWRLHSYWVPGTTPPANLRKLRTPRN